MTVESKVAARAMAPGEPSVAGERPWLAEVVRRESGRRRHDRWVVWLSRIATLVVVLGAWQATAALGLVRAASIGEPTQIVGELGSLLTSQSLYQNLWITLQEALLGLVFGIIGGTIVGVALAAQKQISQALQPLIIGFHSMPKIALAPFAIIWLGLGISSKVLLAALGVFILVLFNVLAGIESIEPEMTANLRVLGFGRLAVVRIVVLPYVGVWIITAMKVSIAAALTGAIVGEYVGAGGGMGSEIVLAVAGESLNAVFALLVVFGVVSSLMYGVVSLLEGWSLRWKRS